MFLAAVAAGVPALAAQNTRTPFKIQIRHADPWAVKALLEGNSLRSPELSTLPGFAGIMSNGANAAQRQLLTDGFLVVNPTDNSLWYFPNK